MRDLVVENEIETIWDPSGSHIVISEYKKSDWSKQLLVEIYFKDNQPPTLI